MQKFAFPGILFDFEFSSYPFRFCLMILIWEIFPHVKYNILQQWILADYLYGRTLPLAHLEHHNACVVC